MRRSSPHTPTHGWAHALQPTHNPKQFSRSSNLLCSPAQLLIGGELRALAAGSGASLRHDTLAVQLHIVALGLGWREDNALSLQLRLEAIFGQVLRLSNQGRHGGGGGLFEPLLSARFNFDSHAHNINWCFMGVSMGVSLCPLDEGGQLERERAQSCAQEQGSEPEGVPGLLLSRYRVPTGSQVHK